MDRMAGADPGLDVPAEVCAEQEQAMIQFNHQIVRDFFAAAGSGNLPDALLTSDMTVWTTTTPGAAPGKKYQAAIKHLQSLFNGGLAYTINSLTAEDDRVAAEIQSRGTLVNGQEFRNTYVFIFRIRDGRIASIAEHFNPDPIREKLDPLMFPAASLRS
jgi:ketosteroid isomerase-like protein